MLLLSKKTCTFAGFFTRTIYYLYIIKRMDEIREMKLNRYNSHIFHIAAVLALLIAWTTPAMAQTKGTANLEGLYYIANSNSYNSGTPANNWYLVPADDPRKTHKADAWFHNQYCTTNISNNNADYTGDNYGDPEKPFLTTYKTNKDAAAIPPGVQKRYQDNSVWILKAVSGESGYYYIIHASTGKYMIYEPPYQEATNRKSMHLQDIVSPDEPGNNAKFEVTLSSGNYTFRPKSVTGTNKYFNPAGTQVNYYCANPNSGQSGTYLHNGMVGLYSSGGNSNWKMESALCKAPVVQYNAAAGTYYITWHDSTANHLPLGYQIRYTTDNTAPTTSSPVYNGDTVVVANDGTHVRAIVTGFNFVGDTPIVLTSEVDQVVNSAVPVAPTFEVTCDSKLQINCDVPEVQIYYTYTTNGTDPADPTNSSNEYTEPVSMADNAKVKAVAYNGAIPSLVTDVYVFKRRAYAPTITFSGTTATITFTEGEVYYTEDGSDPVIGTSSVITTSPHNLTVSETADVEIRAIDTVDGRQPSCPVTVAKRPKKPTFTAVTSCGEGETPERTHILTFTNTEVGKTYWYALSNGAGLPAPALNTFTQYTPGSPVNIAAIPAWNGTAITVTLHAYAKDAEDNPSVVVSQDYMLKYTAAPVITHDGTEVTITGSGTIKYILDGGAEQTYSTPFTVSDHTSHTITATAQVTGEGLSCVSTHFMRLPEPICSLDDIDEMDGAYDLTCDIADASGHISIGTSGNPFTGSFNGNGHTISGLDTALFAYTDGAEIYNLMLDDVNVNSSGTHTGAVVNYAQGNTRIYNVGILGGSLSASGANKHCGGIVGFLTGTSRVINCFSYADITGGDKLGGIVGYNDQATTTSNVKTMVMNCMFYGNISGGNSKAPVYNGKLIDNRSDKKGVNNYNYFLSTAAYVQNLEINPYNAAIAAEPRYLQRFEFHRHLLNSNRALAAWWATGNTANESQMYKWVMLPDSLHSDHPYPILKTQGTYNSPVNYDPINTYDPEGHQMVTRASVDPSNKRNQGGKIGELSVTVNLGSGYPTGASITDGSLTLPIIDKDTAMWNYNYGHVQLPYFHEVGEGNCTHNKVVTGWKITAITAVAGDPYSASHYTGTNYDNPYYNFADRASSNKDKYEVSHRVFSQGAYWDVPESVTEITIEPYWAKCVYLSDSCYDVTYKNDLSSPVSITLMGQRYNNGDFYRINGDLQKVYTSMNNATEALFDGESTDGKTPYNYAVVLVGNYHLAMKATGTFQNNAKPFTLMSADLNEDKEPDFCFLYQHTSRKPVSPIRFDFITIPGMGMAQKAALAQNKPNVGIFQPNGWFEITNTARIELGQFEYDQKTRADAPLILMGGVIVQMVSQSGGGNGNHVTYIHMGGNLQLNEFQYGCHQDQKFSTRHVPVSVSGGEFNEFHLTGTYRTDATIYNDNAECYINGGKFGKVSGAGNEGLGTSADKGNVTWKIDNADMDEFYGGGLNYDKPIKGSINTTISNSHVTLFCGGPKFGDMGNGKTVTTTATKCTFGTFFGAGYGGDSYNRYPPKNLTDNTNYAWNDWINGVGYDTVLYQHLYSSEFKGVATNFTYEFIPMSGGFSNVARVMINHVGFSLATTHGVTSSLKHCVVEENFYGGGSLGKVVGNVTSTLDSCTVMGNAFGAGYSATLKNVKVMNTGGFVTEPYYIGEAGVYQDGVFPASVEYTWEHRGVVNSTATAIDETNHILYTEEDLTTLGTVEGNVTLTLKGNTIIGTESVTTTGHVYGGGDESAVTGNTSVKLQQGAMVRGSVYGGGNRGPVSGNSEVIIQDE